MSDVLKAYQYVSENVPGWIDELHGLQQKIKKRAGHVNRVQVPAKPLKKSGSNESIRPSSTGDDDLARNTSENVQLEVLSAPQQHEVAPEPDTQYLAAPGPRRRTASLVSDGSMPTKFRTRSMIIVYYDSEIQKTFELIVRNIGTARNQLRRAKTTLQMNALINGRDTPSVGSRQPCFGQTPGDSSSPAFRSSRALLSQRSPSEMPSTSQSTNLISTDASLEKAQSLCEKGAHQFLREGDGEAEILGAKESFEEAKRIADQELESLKKDESVDAAEQSDSGQRSKLRPHLQGLLANARLEIDSDPDDGEEVDDPIMKLARYQPRRAGVPLTVPA